MREPDSPRGPAAGRARPRPRQWRGPRRSPLGAARRAGRARLRRRHDRRDAGGRFAVADMAAPAELPAEVKRSLDQWAGCVAGTISIGEYTSALRDAGFRDIDVEVTRETRLEGVDGAIASAYIRARKEATT